MEIVASHLNHRPNASEGAKAISYQPIDSDNYKLVVLPNCTQGVLSKYNIETIYKNHTNVILYNNNLLEKWAECAAYIRFNDFEPSNSRKSVTSHLEGKIIHTIEKDGYALNKETYRVTRVDVKDNTGPTDIFVATLCVIYLQINNLLEYIELANKCVSEEVENRGVKYI